MSFLRRVAAVGACVCLVALPACAAADPSLEELATEPVLQPIAGEVVLAASRAEPRRGRMGVAPRDGAVERVVALAADPAAVADDLQRRYDGRYHFRRTDLGRGTPNTVELRGAAATGSVVIATATTLRPVPLFTPLGAVEAAPPDRPTSLVVTVISRQ